MGKNKLKISFKKIDIYQILKQNIVYYYLKLVFLPVIQTNFKI